MTSEQKQIINLYALLASSAVMMCLIHPMIIMAGIALFIVLLVGVYYYRFRFRDNSMLQHHTRAISRTIWLSFPISLLGIFLYGCIIYFNGDMSPIDRLMEQAQKGVVANQDDIATMQWTLVRLNIDLIEAAFPVAIFPTPTFIVIRSILGVHHVIKKEGGQEQTS